MELPSGEPVELGIALKNFKIRAVLNELGKNAFSGYLAVTIDNVTGMEEGAVLFRGGNITAAVYEYGKLKVTNYGETAFKECMNALHAENGVVDIYQLTRQQAELIVAFKDKMSVTRNLKEMDAEVNAVFSEKFNGEATKQAGGSEQSKIALLKQFGLADVNK